MSALDAAVRPHLPAQRLPWWIAAALAVSFAVAGLVGLTMFYAGTDTYTDLLRGRGVVTLAIGPDATRGGVTLHADQGSMAEIHRETLEYVLGERSDPARCCDGRPVFDANERAHLADVRAVFAVARILGLVAVATLLVLAWAVTRAGRAAALRAVRDAALAAALMVAVLGVIAAFAFEPAFLAFHYLFFPQGNFLFDPATSALLAVYPEEYWYGVTLRIGITFVAVAAAITLLATFVLRARDA